MSYNHIELLLIMSLTAMACALPGVYLVLRRMALLSDAIGHVLLFGIVIAYFITRDLHSIGLVIGAALSGLVLVAAVEMLTRSKLVKEDAAIGLVFPALFAGGILLLSMRFKNVHLDVDQVFLGMPELAVNQSIILGVYDIGSVARWIMIGTLLLNAAFIAIFWKELKLATFDAGLAAALGFLPGVLHYALMGLVSLTAVTAFESVGPVLVVAFMIVPGATAYLLTDRMGRMMLLALLIAVVGAILGTLLAIRFDTNIAGTVSTMLGVLFGVAFVFSPSRGLAVQVARRARQRREFFETLLLIHLLHHEGTPEQEDECRQDRVHEHLRWKPADVLRVVERLIRDAKVQTRDGQLFLNEPGRTQARATLAHIGGV
jgi:manganese/zinc/iron transport system permease protein